MINLRYFRNQSRHTWLSAMIGFIPVFIWVNLALLVMNTLIWVLGGYFGEGHSFDMDLSEHLEWSFETFCILNGLYLAGRIVESGSNKNRTWIRVVGVILGACVGGIVIDIYYQYIAVLFGIHFNMNIVYFDIKLPVYVTNTVTYTFWGVLISIPVSIYHNVRYKHMLELKIEQLEKAHLEQIKNKAVLEALRAKVNPHFLYNALNSIASLMDSNTEKAEEMIVSLSDLFRYSINSSKSHFTTVSSEIEMIEIYLKIEKIRFGDQLECEFNIDRSCKTERIPKFLLQPIIENAIKHGTSKIENGRITISAYLKSDDVVLEVSDNGPQFKDDFVGGHGLENVRERLELLYGKNYSFNILSEQHKTTVRICMKRNPQIID